MHTCSCLTTNSLRARSVGLRPLALGRFGDAYVVASESCAFETIGATFLRDVEPGETIVVDHAGLRSLPPRSRRSGRCAPLNTSTLLAQIVILTAGMCTRCANGWATSSRSSTRRRGTSSSASRIRVSRRQRVRRAERHTAGDGPGEEQVCRSRPSSSPHEELRDRRSTEAERGAQRRGRSACHSHR